MLRAPWLTALGPCLQFHDICFGGAPAMGHQEPELLDAVFPSFELRLADVRPLSLPSCSEGLKLRFHVAISHPGAEPSMVWEVA